MENKVLPRKRKRLMLRAALQLILPAGVGGFILGFSITLDFYQALYSFVFGSFIAFVAVFLNNLNRILFLYNFKRLSFVVLQLLKFALVPICISIIIGFFFYFKYGYIVFSKEHIDLLVVALISSLAVGYSISISFLFNRMVGNHVLRKYLSGRYFNPKEEERIFMFIDLKSSTTIAEQIGHKQFFSLINDLLFEITNPIIENEGEIYKYVGDEIIITWSLKKGLRNNHCIHVFFDIEHRLLMSRAKYLKKYGVTPKFKAGVHVGKVIVGEMGDFKSEIAYMGDAVNTTARIQSECKVHKANLLISKELLSLLPDHHSYQYEELDKLRLKGKLTDTVLIKVTSR